MRNHTSMSTFQLMGFSDVRELQILYFLAFLVLYLMAVIGNLFIIVAMAFDYHLHTPMYFFLFNLAMSDLGSVSVIVPKSMAMSLMEDMSISYCGCVAQVFFYFFFISSDYIILIIMAHDRQVAICNPLQYERIMHKEACFQMAATGWFTSFVYAMLHTGGIFANTFCSNKVSQFFCEVPYLLKLSCSNIYFVEAGLLVLSIGIALGCFIFIILTYVKIFSTVLRISSVQGQRKAFSTCIPHLAVISVLLFSGIFGYVKPLMNTSSAANIAVSVIYSIIPPLLNPIIYSMRNKELRTALWKLLKVKFPSKTILSDHSC